MWPIIRKRSEICFSIFSIIYFSNILLLIVQNSLATAAEVLYAGDACKLVSGGPGICKSQKECDRKLLKDIPPKDILRCSFDVYGEIICCPVDSRVTTPMPTTTSTTTKSPSKERVGQERAAVRACREIEENAGKTLTFNIYGGKEVKLSEFPHMAVIGFSSFDNDDGPYDFDCGGALIDKRYVLTAAHCLVSRSRKPKIIRMGITDLENQSQLKNVVDIKVDEVIIHNDYELAKTYNDIALIKLEHDIPVAQNVYPSCIYTNISDLPVNTTLVVTGWGLTNITTRENSKKLLKAELKVQSLNVCRQDYSQFDLGRRLDRGVDDSQMCAYDPEGEQDACQGDSGGPLNYIINEADNKIAVVGIVAVGLSCGTSRPSLYTRVAAYLDFIESTVWPHWK